jgi:hypothetical protein
MRRISLSLALVVTCLLVLAACGGKSKSSSAGSNSGSGIAGAEIAPASATSFASITTDSTGAQWKQAVKLMAGVPALQSSINDSLSSSGITLAEAEQALGTTTAIVEFGTSAKPTEVFFTNTKDPAKLKSLLAKDKTEKSVTTEIDSWVVIAKSQAALDEFKTAAASGKLADDSAFKTAVKGLPADALVKAYFKGSAISTSALSSLGSGSSSTTTTTTTTSSMSKTLGKAVANQKVEWGTLAVSAVPKGLSIDGVFKTKTSPTNSSLSLIDELPSGTAFAVDLNGTSIGLDKAVTSLRNNSKYASTIPQIEAALGVKLSDLAALAGSELSIYGTDSGIGLLVKAADAPAAKAMLDKAVALLSAQMNASTKSTTVGGVKATQVTSGATTLYYGVKDGNLFIVTDASALPGNTKLSSDSAYNAAATGLPIPASNLGVAYINFAKLAALSKSGSSVIKSLGSSSGANANMSNLEGLSSLLGYATANGNKVEFKGLLSTTG